MAPLSLLNSRGLIGHWLCCALCRTACLRGGYGCLEVYTTTSTQNIALHVNYHLINMIYDHMN